MNSFKFRRKPLGWLGPGCKSTNRKSCFSRMAWLYTFMNVSGDTSPEHSSAISSSCFWFLLLKMMFCFCCCILSSELHHKTMIGCIAFEFLIVSLSCTTMLIVDFLHAFLFFTPQLLKKGRNTAIQQVRTSMNHN